MADKYVRLKYYSNNTRKIHFWKTVEKNILCDNIIKNTKI